MRPANVFRDILTNQTNQPKLLLHLSSEWKLGYAQCVDQLFCAIRHLKELLESIIIIFKDDDILEIQYGLVFVFSSSSFLDLCVGPFA